MKPTTIEEKDFVLRYAPRPKVKSCRLKRELYSENDFPPALCMANGIEDTLAEGNWVDGFCLELELVDEKAPLTQYRCFCDDFVQVVGISVEEEKFDFVLKAAPMAYTERSDENGAFHVLLSLACIPTDEEANDSFEWMEGCEKVLLQVSRLHIANQFTETSFELSGIATCPTDGSAIDCHYIETENARLGLFEFPDEDEPAEEA